MKKISKSILSILTLVCLLFTTFNIQASEIEESNEFKYTTSINYGTSSSVAEININYENQDINYVDLPNGKKQLKDFNRTNLVVFENDTYTFIVNYNNKDEIKEETITVTIDGIKTVTPTQENNAFFYGNGGLDRFTDMLSQDTYYDGAEKIKIVATDHKITMPSTTGDITNYEYELKGWYDVFDKIYYSANNFDVEMPLNNDKFFYPDYYSKHYDYGNSTDDNLVEGQFSTNYFIKTDVFDFNELFNVYSANPKYVYNNNNPYIQWVMNETDPKSESNLNYAFVNWPFSDISILGSYNRSLLYAPITQYGDGDPRSIFNSNVRPGLITDSNNKLTSYGQNLLNKLFSTNDNTLGKNYLGSGDYLYQYNEVVSDHASVANHEGYFYVDSRVNSVNYSQSDQRFYTYAEPSFYTQTYLERDNNGNINEKIGRNASSQTENKIYGFYPFNYPNTNTTADPNNLITSINGKTNYSFGLKSEIEFYLADEPGTTNANIGTDGNDMIFQFNGDDDLWVFVDDEIVLDLGGVHGQAYGNINFSTGIVNANGNIYDLSKNITDGHHKLTIYYLERGSSDSNLQIAFNLLPRFDLVLRKVDSNTKNTIEGVDFEIYTDEECTTPAEFINKPVLTTNSKGEIICTNLELDSTYYIKEASTPTGYVSNTENIIKLDIDDHGNVTVTNSINDSAILNTDLYEENSKIVIDVNNTKIPDVPTGVSNDLNLFNLLLLASSISILVYIIRFGYKKYKSI